MKNHDPAEYQHEYNGRVAHTSDAAIWAITQTKDESRAIEIYKEYMGELSDEELHDFIYGFRLDVAREVTRRLEGMWKEWRAAI